MSKARRAEFASPQACWRPPAAFQHSIPHLAKAAISNLYMAGWDYFSPIWDIGVAHAARHAGTGPRNAGQCQRDVATGPLPAGGQLFGGTGPLRISAAKPGTSACSDGPGFSPDGPGWARARFPRIGPVSPDGPGFPGWARFPRIGLVSPDRPGFPGWARFPRMGSSGGQQFRAAYLGAWDRASHETCTRRDLHSIIRIP